MDSMMVLVDIICHEDDHDDIASQNMSKCVKFVSICVKLCHYRWVSVVSLRINSVVMGYNKRICTEYPDHWSKIR